MAEASNSPKSNALRDAYTRFRARIEAARKKTKQVVSSLEEKKRASRIAELERKIKGAA